MTASTLYPTSQKSRCQSEQIYTQRLGSILPVFTVPLGDEYHSHREDDGSLGSLVKMLNEANETKRKGDETFGMLMEGRGVTKC